jgi:hypothetical protein
MVFEFGVQIMLVPIIEPIVVEGDPIIYYMRNDEARFMRNFKSVILLREQVWCRGIHSVDKIIPNPILHGVITTIEDI